MTTYRQNDSECLYLLYAWLIELKVYVPLDVEIGHFGNVLSQPITELATEETEPNAR